jgi:biopolymer transport protein ExbB
MIWEITAQEYLAIGGPVMIPLVFVSLLLAYLIAERYFYLAGMGRGDITADDVIEKLKQDSAPNSGKGLLCTMLQRLLAAKRIYGRLDVQIIEESKKGFLPELTRNFNIITCLITAAPLLGLLGTVTGMIRTFNVMNIFGTSNPKAMSGGISEALITTQYGLVVAIIGMYIQLFVEKRARRYVHIIEELTRHIIRKFEL